MSGGVRPNYEGIGLHGGIVQLSPYDSRWPSYYDQESAAIRAACGPELVRVDHVGSTSVPGLCAKPIIDLMGGIETFDDGFKLNEPLASLGYTALGELGIPGRHLFSLRDGEIRLVHFHVFVIESDDWRRHLAFRDYLRSNPQALADYVALKQALQNEHATDRDGYTDAKTEFIRGIERLAGED